MSKLFTSKKNIYIFAAVCIAAVIAAALIIIKTMSGSLSKNPAPFSTLTWESSYDDMINAEGDGFSSYDSVYGGLCYTYPKAYEGLNGTVKYMFDDKGSLMNISWTYSTDDLESLDILYKKIASSVSSKYGESGYKPQGSTNYGDVWYLDSGNIVLSVISTGDVTALQYGCMHPDVSHERPDK